MALDVVLVWLAVVGHMGMTQAAVRELGLLYRQAVAARVEAMACAYGLVAGDSITIVGIGPAVVRVADARSVVPPAQAGPCPPGIVAVVHVHLPAALVNVPGYDPCADGPDDRAMILKQAPPRPVDVIVCGVEAVPGANMLRSTP